MGLEAFLNGYRPCYNGPNFNGNSENGTYLPNAEIPDLKYFNQNLASVNYNQENFPTRWPVVKDGIELDKHNFQTGQTIAGLESKSTGNLLGLGAGAAIGAVVGGLLGFGFASPVTAVVGSYIGGLAGYFIGGKVAQEASTYSYVTADANDDGRLNGSPGGGHA